MLSISKNESEILEFLIRNYSGSYTIRKIGEILGMSPATAHKAVKDLEKKGLLSTERIGPSLICRPDLKSRRSRHIAEAILAEEEGTLPESIKSRFSAVLLNGKDALAVTGDSLSMKEDEQRAFSDFSIRTIQREEFEEGIYQRKRDILEMISKSKIIHGETFIVDVISRRGLH